MPVTVLPAAPAFSTLFTFAVPRIDGALLDGPFVMDATGALYGTTERRWNLYARASRVDTTGLVNWGGETVADVNRDGKADLIYALLNNGVLAIAVSLGNGDGTFQNPVFLDSNIADDDSGPFSVVGGALYDKRQADFSRD